jgi:hypothetical protein
METLVNITPAGWGQKLKKAHPGGWQLPRRAVSLDADFGQVFGEAALVVPGRARLLTSWIISIAKDLRDKLANNKQWFQARSLEERCKLFGLAFDPLPKQPFE